MTATEKTQAIETVQKAVIETPTFSINNYIDWFDKINLNTFFWQTIALIALFYFGKEIKMLLKGIVSKIPQIKSVGGLEFHPLSEETKTEIAKKDRVLSDEIEPYMVAIEQDPNMVFLNHFIEFERNLDKLYWEAFPNARDFMRESPAKMLDSLVKAEKLESKALSAFYDIRTIRNEIVHGKKTFSGIEEAKPYLQAVFLLKNIVNSGLEKVLKNKKDTQA